MGVRHMMKTYILIFCILACVLFAEAKKYSKQQMKVIKKFKNLKAKAAALEGELASLNQTVSDLEKAVSVSNRHTFGVDELTVVDADSTGSSCGPFTLTSWTTNLDIYIAAGANADSQNQFSGGTFTNRKSGYYHICSFTRFRQGGNANDNTVLVGGTIVAAYGSGITEDWLTTGVCFDTFLAANTAVQVRHESGGSSDCVESTGWPHNKFTVHTIAND